MRSRCHSGQLRGSLGSSEGWGIWTGVSKAVDGTHDDGTLEWRHASHSRSLPICTAAAERRATHENNVAVSLESRGCFIIGVRRLRSRWIIKVSSGAYATPKLADSPRGGYLLMNHDGKRARKSQRRGVKGRFSWFDNSMTRPERSRVVPGTFPRPLGSKIPSAMTGSFGNGSFGLCRLDQIRSGREPRRGDKIRQRGREAERGRV